jgi:hypothetical protein
MSIIFTFHTITHETFELCRRAWNDRNGDNRHRRSMDGGGFNNRGSRGSAREYVAPKSEDNHSRVLSSYMDIDAPKVPVKFHV